MASRSGSASGRLDVLGGVADYAGALVLELPTAVRTTVHVDDDDELVVGPARLSPSDIATLAAQPYAEIRAALEPFPTWTHYVLGVVIVLVRHGLTAPPTGRVSVLSSVPQSVGVSSSAALEVAVARAFAPPMIDAVELAMRCQEAENHVVGAPCGIMDQLTVAVGRRGAILPILCRPATVLNPIDLPPDLEVVGWPTGAEHAVTGAPYHRARCAAFMGKRIVEAATGSRWAWISELPAERTAALPDVLDGGEFLDRWGATEDPLTTVERSVAYPVRAATSFGAAEHLRSERALETLAAGEAEALTPLLAASHADYEAMGLGHPAADAVVADALARPGVHGARSSGGGSGGSVVCVCERGALDDVEGLIR